MLCTHRAPGFVKSWCLYGHSGTVATGLPRAHALQGALFGLDEEQLGDSFQLSPEFHAKDPFEFRQNLLVWNCLTGLILLDDFGRLVDLLG